MKKMKFNATLVLILALLAVSVSSFAQNKESKTKKSPEERAKISTERMKTSLNLSDEQSSKIYDLNLQRMKDRKEFKEGKSKVDSDRKNKRNEYKNSLKSILTEEQYNSMKKMHKDKKDKKGKKDKKSKKEYRNKTND